MDGEWIVDDRAGWDRLNGAAPWQQRWAYGAAVEALGGRVLRGVARLGRRVVAQAQFTARSLGPLAHGALAARGPVFAPDASESERVAACRVLRRTAPLPWPRLVLLAPDGAEAATLRAAGLACVVTGAARATLDLGPAPEALRAALDQKWRNRLKAGERTGLRVILDDAPSAQTLAAVAAREAAQGRARGYANTPVALAAAWGRLAGRRSLTLAQADSTGETVATMLFVRHGAGALQHCAWRAPQAPEGAHPLLLWRAMLALRAQGVATLDLGPLDTRRAAGLARFKLGSGAQPVPSVGLWT